VLPFGGQVGEGGALVIGVHGFPHGVLDEADFGGVVAFGQHPAGDGRILGQLARLGEVLEGAEASAACDHLEALAVCAGSDVEVLAEAMGCDGGSQPLNAVCLTDVANVRLRMKQPVERDGLGVGIGRHGDGLFLSGLRCSSCCNSARRRDRGGEGTSAIDAGGASEPRPGRSCLGERGARAPWPPPGAAAPIRMLRQGSSPEAETPQVAPGACA
jgi:hypothetical protein